MTTENKPMPAVSLAPAEKPKWTDRLLYSRSFLARLALSDDGTRGYYAEVAKKLLGYEKVKSRVRWSGAAFNVGRTAFAKVAIAGKTLCLYLAIDPGAITGKYKAKYAGAKKYEKTPAMLKIRSDGALRGAIKAIEACAAVLGLIEKTEAGEVEKFPADTFDNLVTRGLIRVIKNANAGKNHAADADEEADDYEPETEENKEETAEEDTAATADDTAGESGADESENRGAGEAGAASATSEYLKELAKKYRAYEETRDAMSAGEVTAALREKLMLRAVDERWIDKVENALGAIDYLMRNPGHYIAETEEVLPVEMTKKITGRSIAYLGQHSDNISVNDDGEITPKKLLNVFREDSIFTYENKFLNTLIARLYLFVTKRCEIAKKFATDEKHREMTYTASFREGFDRARVTIKVEYDSACNENARRTFPSTETRRRLEKLEAVVREYAASEFVTNMDGKYVNPPVLRTNAIVKNKYFRQCLDLWDFIERYDDAGFGLTVSETVLDPGEEYLSTLGNLAAASYITFRKNACGADGDAIAANTYPEIYPRIIDEPYALDPKAYDLTAAAAARDTTESGGESPAEKATELTTRLTKEELALAIEIALYADDAMYDPIENFEAGGADYAYAEDEEEDEAADEPGENAEEAAENDTGTENAAETAKNDTETEKTEEDDEEKFDFGGIKYVRTFHARIRLADEKTKEYYAAVLNAFLKYGKARVNESNRYCAVYAGRKTLAKINVTGKTLKVYFALDPAAQDKKYFLKEAGESKAYAAVPALMRIRSDRACRYAEELVGVLAVKEGLSHAKKPAAPIDPKNYAAMTTEEFLARGWIKDLGGETDEAPAPRKDNNDERLREAYRFVPPAHGEIRQIPTGNNEGWTEAAATIEPPAPETLDANAENSAKTVAAKEEAAQTLPDVVQIAADYSKPTDYGVDDSSDFIEFMKPAPAKPDRKGFFKRLFSVFRKRNK